MPRQAFINCSHSRCWCWSRCCRWLHWLGWLHWLDASVAIRLTFLILALFVAEISDTLIEVLPWLALFLVGMVIGRWLVAEPETAAARVSGLCRVCLLAGLAIVGLDLAAGTIPALGFLHGDPWWRLVRVRTGFFPAGPGIVLLLQAGVLLLLAVALRRERSRELDPRGWLVCMTRR